jgi:hypothetical protein
MSIRRHLVAASAALCLGTPLLSGAVAHAQTARQDRDYPQFGPAGPWHLHAGDDADHGGFKVKLKKGKPPELTKITYITGVERAGCPVAGTVVKVIGKVVAKPAPELEGVLGYDPWTVAKGYQPNNPDYAYYGGLKPVAVKVQVGSAAPVAGQVAFQFVKQQPHKKYYGVDNVIGFGDCILDQAPFSYPDK